MRQSQVLLQSQQLKMNAQMFQSIKLMELPIIDLREKIEEEVEKNPALEVRKDPGIISLDAVAEKLPKEEESYFEASSDAGFIRRGTSVLADLGGNFQKGMDTDEHNKFLEGAISQAETLQEHLLWQLALETADKEVRHIGELLIQNLDDDGFHKEPLEELLKDKNSHKAEAALALVRSLDPPGTCCSGYMESLAVQARLLPDFSPEIEAALEHLEELEKGNFTETARILGLDKTGLQDCYERIKTELFPFPGRRFTYGETRYAIPDLEVRHRDGDLVIVLNHEEIPVLGISPFFLKIADEKDKGRETRNFAKENIKEARWFINSINQRNHTLLRTARAILEFQRPFFTKGPKYLGPLTLRDIAAELGVHETTISRISHGKYMQTEWGLFELRHFFSNSIGSGSGFSKEAVKEILKEIISGDGCHLSDHDLTEMLAQRGIALARRTVAKYRKELDLGSSYTR
ncbi:MAG: RNA polymerase factor sigma-54 [Treponema sp.]|jgi:RNA polymerase sigma-54 factor|nr:RNA polymerase factor sigma-54 [Treponema sp.]